MKHGLEKARNPKLILSTLEQLWDLNFLKSDFFCEAQDKAALYAELFSCKQGQFHVSYLDILIHY
jgi:hypothetical protein